jgi:hypothetical protein
MYERLASFEAARSRRCGSRQHAINHVSRMSDRVVHGPKFVLAMSATVLKEKEPAMVLSRIDKKIQDARGLDFVDFERLGKL